MSFSTRLSLISLFSVALLALLVAWRLGWYGWQSWLLAVNFITLLLFGYDKAAAGSGRLRIPEKTLLIVSFLGGSPAALLSMQLFRHKTSKPLFLRSFWLITVSQGVLVAAWIYLAKRFS